MDHGNATCTAQMSGARFCELPSIPYAPFPICAAHARRIYMHVRDEMREALERPDALERLTDPEWLAAEVRRHCWQRPASFPDAGMKPPPTTAVVYYVQTGDLVKIGTTTSVRDRMRTFSPNSVLLATEPGHYDVEARRHAQFAADRVSGEWFTLSNGLFAHIEGLTTRAA